MVGIEEMRARRPGRPDRDLLRGPGNLCRALGVTGEHDFHPVQSAPLLLAPGAPVADAEVAAGPRIGITRAADAPLRFRVRGDPYVSR